MWDNVVQIQKSDSNLASRPMLEIKILCGNYVVIFLNQRLDAFSSRYWALLMTTFVECEVLESLCNWLQL